MKIYYKYTNRETLDIDSGDNINELNCMEALRKISEVYYSHRKYNGNYTTQRLPTRQEYGAYIIRSNKPIFLSVQAPRYWIYSPYDEQCYSGATKIFTFSEAGANVLRNGTKCLSNPYGKKFNNVVAIHQAIGTHIIPRQNHTSTQNMRTKFASELIIGHFGRTVKSNWPHLLATAWPDILKKYTTAKLLIGESSRQFPILDKQRVMRYKVKYAHVPYYISACDMIILSQHGEEWNYCGNQKTKEAASCGVPVILERSDAREEEFGIDYPLFMPRGSMAAPTRNSVDLLLSLIGTALKDKEQIGTRLVERMKFYSIDSMAERMKGILGT